MKHFILSAIAVGAAATPLLAQNSTGSYQDQYGVLTERNMFMRERPRPRPPRDSSRSTPRVDTTSPQAVERAIVLRGVAIEDNELHAYLENSRTGQRFRLVPGDNLASGHVDEIAIDAIAYEANGQTIWIEIGQNLSGAKAESSSGSSRYSRGGYSSGGYRGDSNSSNNSNGSTATNEAPPDGSMAQEGQPHEEPQTPSPSASSLEERMKQRRMQQRGGGK